jgi:hypothetical protein
LESWLFLLNLNATSACGIRTDGRLYPPQLPFPNRSRADKPQALRSLRAKCKNRAPVLSAVRLELQTADELSLCLAAFYKIFSVLVVRSTIKTIEDVLNYNIEFFDFKFYFTFKNSINIVPPRNLKNPETRSFCKDTT